MNWRSTLSRCSAASLLLLPLVAGCGGPVEAQARGEYLFGYCAQCHGEDAGGNERYRAPAIAGLDQWYLQAQLEKFRSGARGDHPDDVEGLRMRPMSRTLMSDDDVTIISSYIAALPRVRPAPALAGGNVTQGQSLYQPCVACHGERGEGRREVNGPPLARLNDWYLLAQLEKFKSGIRGADPLDETGAQMRPLALSLDEQAMNDVVAYILSLN